MPTRFQVLAIGIGFKVAKDFLNLGLALPSDIWHIRNLDETISGDGPGLYGAASSSGEHEPSVVHAELSWFTASTFLGDLAEIA